MPDSHKLISELADAVMEYEIKSAADEAGSSQSNGRLNALLAALAGGAIGGAGGYLTTSDAEYNEDEDSRRARARRRALIGALLGTGAGGLAGSLGTAMTSDTPTDIKEQRSRINTSDRPEGVSSSEVASSAGRATADHVKETLKELAGDARDSLSGSVLDRIVQSLGLAQVATVPRAWAGKPALTRTGTVLGAPTAVSAKVMEGIAKKLDIAGRSARQWAPRRWYSPVRGIRSILPSGPFQGGVPEGDIDELLSGKSGPTSKRPGRLDPMREADLRRRIVAARNSKKLTPSRRATKIRDLKSRIGKSRATSKAMKSRWMKMSPKQRAGFSAKIRPTLDKRVGGASRALGAGIPGIIGTIMAAPLIKDIAGSAGKAWGGGHELQDLKTIRNGGK